MELVPYRGWNRNARLVCNDVEMIVTLDVGPRVLHYGFVGGENEMRVDETLVGSTGDKEYHSYGGHRLWIGPEEPARTMQPDNGPVEHREEDGFHVFASAPDVNLTQKEMRIRPEPDRDRFLLVHRIYNRGAYPLELAPWTPTQFAPGGVGLFPQAPYRPHTEQLLPARPMVLWAYTRMDDPRWTWGRTVIRLRQDRAMGPQKVGALVEQGYAAHANGGRLHLRRFEHVPGATYPDFGCNYETFTNEAMLEIESLGPMQTVRPGAYAEHTEAWYLLRDQTPPEEDEACGRWLAELARERPL